MRGEGVQSNFRGGKGHILIKKEQRVAGKCHALMARLSGKKRERQPHRVQKSKVSVCSNRLVLFVANVVDTGMIKGGGKTNVGGLEEEKRRIRRIREG